MNDSTTQRGFGIVTALTIVRLPLSLLFAALVLATEPDSTTLTIGVVLLSLIEITDGLDGYLARRLGAESKFGAILDPYSDAVSRVTVYWALAACGKTYLFMPLALGIRDVTVAYCRIVWTRANRSAGALLSGKIKAVVQGVGAFTLLLAPHWFPDLTWLPPVTAWVVVLVTYVSLFEYVAQTLPLLRNKP
ncbi:MAG: CDP-alcohol phosphatidyltransferase family protein [Pirellulales bacterium]